MLRLSCLFVADTTSRRPVMSLSAVRCSRRCPMTAPCCPPMRARSWARWRGWSEVLAMLWITLLWTLRTSMDVLLHTLTYRKYVSFKLRLELVLKHCWRGTTGWKMERRKEGQVTATTGPSHEQPALKWRKKKKDCVLLDWRISVFPKEKTLETLGEWPLLKEAGWWVQIWDWQPAWPCLC